MMPHTVRTDEIHHIATTTGLREPLGPGGVKVHDVTTESPEEKQTFYLTTASCCVFHMCFNTETVYIY